MTSNSPSSASLSPDELTLRAALDPSRALLARTPEPDIHPSPGLAIDRVSRAPIPTLG